MQTPPVTPEIGLWIQTSEGETFLIKKDAQGYPDFSGIGGASPLSDRDLKKQKIRDLYESLSGKSYTHSHATLRQMLWDFIEMAIHRLP